MLLRKTRVQSLRGKRDVYRGSAVKLGETSVTLQKFRGNLILTYSSILSYSTNVRIGNHFQIHRIQKKLDSQPLFLGRFLKDECFSGMSAWGPNLKATGQSPRSSLAGVGGHTAQSVGGAGPQLVKLMSSPDWLAIWRILLIDIYTCGGIF